MSSTVTYKGSQIATVSNATVTLETSGTWLEDDITITDVTSGGTSYETEFNELLDMIQGNLTTVDNSTITSLKVLMQSTSVTTMKWNALTTTAGNGLAFNTALLTAVFPAMTITGYDMLRGDNHLTAVDFGSTLTKFAGYTFEACSALTTIVIRSATVPTLVSVNAFDGSPFKNGGSGGTIYVPSSLISSYQSATNWSTLDGYGTVTWSAIEGSQYENYYVDGSAI